MLGGCGEKIAGEVQKAVGQVKAEASKVANEEIESMSTAALDKLKKMQGQTGKQKSEDKPLNNAGEKAEKWDVPADLLFAEKISMTSLLPVRFLTPKRLFWASIGLAIATIALKTLAWYVTDSVGLPSDAMESFVNRASAIFAMMMVTIAQRQADDAHPYGHAWATGGPWEMSLATSDDCSFSGQAAV